MAKIVFLRGPYSDQELDLPDTGVLIGRGPEAALVIEDEQISQRHAQLTLEDGTWWIEDLASSNGTLLNQAPVLRNPLKAGDVVTMGDTEFVFEPGPEEAPPEEAPDHIPVLDGPSIELPKPPTVSSVISDDTKLLGRMTQRMERVRSEVAKVYAGNLDALEQVIAAMAAGGHVLLDGPTGTGKSVIAAAVARAFDLEFTCMEMYPTMTAADLIGLHAAIEDPATGRREMKYVAGPVITNVFVPRNVNRMPPLLQAMLFRIMDTGSVTLDNITHDIPKPFMVAAARTLTPGEDIHPMLRTQIDRFLLCVHVDYPTLADEQRTTKSAGTRSLAEIEPVFTREEIGQLHEIVRQFRISDYVINYAIRLVRATRPTDPESVKQAKAYVEEGASLRASQDLILAAKAFAVLGGRFHTSCDDVRKMLRPVLAHRIYLNAAAREEGVTLADILAAVLAEVTESGRKDKADEDAGPSGRKLVTLKKK